MEAVGVRCVVGSGAVGVSRYRGVEAGRGRRRWGMRDEIAGHGRLGERLEGMRDGKGGGDVLRG